MQFRVFEELQLRKTFLNTLETLSRTRLRDCCLASECRSSSSLVLGRPLHVNSDPALRQSSGRAPCALVGLAAALSLGARGHWPSAWWPSSSGCRSKASCRGSGTDMRREVPDRAVRIELPSPALVFLPDSCRLETLLSRTLHNPDGCSRSEAAGRRHRTAGRARRCRGLLRRVRQRSVHGHGSCCDESSSAQVMSREADCVREGEKEEDDSQKKQVLEKRAKVEEETEENPYL